ncbi:MAG: TonB-dependent receptor [Deltaproteobacteria bacterium]|nr:TonB-dependent receptor [Deltaproteobacteria bacterium]
MSEASVLEADLKANFSETESVLFAFAPFRDRAQSDQFSMSLQSRTYFNDDKLSFVIRADQYQHRFSKAPLGDLAREDFPTFCVDADALVAPVSQVCPAEMQLKTYTLLREGRGEATYDTSFHIPFFGKINTALGLVAITQSAHREDGDRVNGLDESAKRIDYGAAYLELSSRPLPFLLIVPGIRGQAFTTGNELNPLQSVLTPKISVRLDLPFQTFIRTSYGSGFRRPSFLERFLRFDHSELGYVVNGNPELRPESNHGLRIEGGWNFGSFTSSIEGYLNLLEDMIVERSTGNTTGAGIPIYTYENRDHGLFAGINARLALESWHGFSGELNGQYLPYAVDNSACRLRDELLCDDAETLPLRAPLSLHLRTRYALAATETRFTAHAEALSPRLIGDGTFAPQAWYSASDSANPSPNISKGVVAAENLLGGTHALYGPKPGRNLQLNLRGVF